MKTEQMNGYTNRNSDLLKAIEQANRKQEQCFRNYVINLLKDIQVDTTNELLIREDADLAFNTIGLRKEFMDAIRGHFDEANYTEPVKFYHNRFGRPVDVYPIGDVRICDGHYYDTDPSDSVIGGDIPEAILNRYNAEFLSYYREYFNNEWPDSWLWSNAVDLFYEMAMELSNT